MKDDFKVMKSDVSSLKNHINSQVLNNVMDRAYENATESFEKCKQDLVKQWNDYRQDIAYSYSKQEELQKQYQKTVTIQQQHTESLIEVIVSIHHKIQ